MCVGLRHDLLNKEWVEMCGVTYNPDAMTDEPKIHGVTAAGEATTTGRRGIWRRGTKGYPYIEEREVGSELRGYTGVIIFWDPCRICVLGVHVVDKETDSYDGI